MYNRVGTAVWYRDVAFLAAIHVVPLAAFARGGVTAADWIACAVLYVSIAFGVGIGLHRYFAHRSFKTSRAFQFALAVLSSTGFTDPISFAGKHRIHHRLSDRDHDVHAPHDGFWQCWFGSLADCGYSDEEVAAYARDWMRFPELVWLRRYFYVPGTLLGAGVLWFGGFTMFAIGFCLSRALILNGTSAVNYLCHRFGSRPFAVHDESRNNALVALLTFGEGWHNNHHHYPRAARAGFRWWEFDLLYVVIRGLALAGIVWDVRDAPHSLKAATRESLPGGVTGPVPGGAA